ncbi:MAG TPA: polyprenyl synthetase family protein [Acidobacteriota bacterium]|nr:polyprenyl synthetase family protein [Acidobacteriota bacterium]HRR27685.1 polyprenyl synthetase family protein [Acidobacteriota bacterium]HRR56610.1 polyprenyl synthetase family protein [Acidobacteriota bacterium]
MNLLPHPPGIDVPLFDLVQDDLEEVERRLKLEALCKRPLIAEINHYLHDSGGKRLRPALLLLSAHHCGAPAETAIRLGVVVELIHVATLVHDDIIDRADLRRGRPSVNARWGNDVTVLFGDWLYMTAFWIALQERKFEILDILIDVTRRMVEGELIQLERKHRLDITESEYLEICRHKTAYLFSSCAQLGAVAAEQPRELAERMASFGCALGMAFQLTDDLLDFTADESVLGKPVLKDLEEGNVTLPFIEMMKRAPEEDRRFLQSMVQERRYTPENMRRVMRLVRVTGALQFAQSEAERYAAEASHHLEDLPETPYLKVLRTLPNVIVHRRK